MHERVLGGVELRPPCGDGPEEGRPVRPARDEAGGRGVLWREGEGVVYERGRAVELCPRGAAERLELPAGSFQDLQYRCLPRLTGELGTDPWVGVDRVEHPEGNRADGLLWLCVTDHPGHAPGDDVVGGRREQLVLAGDVPVDGSAACLQARRQRTEGQSAFAAGVKDLDRGRDDPLLRERVRAPPGPLCPVRHRHHLDITGTLFQTHYGTTFHAS